MFICRKLVGVAINKNVNIKLTLKLKMTNNNKNLINNNLKGFAFTVNSLSLSLRSKMDPLKTLLFFNNIVF